jgi:hypothetical protein
MVEDQAGQGKSGERDVRWTLSRMHMNLLDDHLSHCLAGGLAPGDVAAEGRGRGLLGVVQRFAWIR